MTPTTSFIYSTSAFQFRTTASITSQSCSTASSQVATTLVSASGQPMRQVIKQIRQLHEAPSNFTAEKIWQLHQQGKTTTSFTLRRYTHSYESKLKNNQLLEIFLLYFTHLIELNVSWSNITMLPQLPDTLKKLDLSWCKNLADIELFGALLDAENLEELNISRTNLCIVSRLPKSIKRLKLSGCKNLVESTLWSTIKDLPLLEELDLSDTDITILPKSLPPIRKLDLALCTRLSDKAIHVALSTAKALQELNLSWTKITMLLQLPPTIKKLNISYCKNFIVSGFCGLIANASKLEELNVIGTTISQSYIPPKSLKLYLKTESPSTSPCKVMALKQI